MIQTKSKLEKQIRMVCNGAEVLRTKIARSPSARHSPARPGIDHAQPPKDGAGALWSPSVVAHQQPRANNSCIGRNHH